MSARRNERYAKARALVLASIVVVSVFGATVAFAGSAAAATADVTITGEDSAQTVVDKIESAGDGEVVEIQNGVNVSISEPIDVDNSSVVIRGEDENLANGPTIQMDDLGTGTEGFSVRAADVEIRNLRIEDDASAGVAWNVRTTKNGTVVDNVAIERDESNASLSALENPAVNFIDVSEATVTDSRLTNGAVNLRLASGGQATISGNQFDMPDGFPNAFFVTGESFNPLSESATLTVEDNGELAIADRTESDYVRGFTTVSGAFSAPQTGDPVGENGTVTVAAGTYEKPVTITTKNVTLQAAEGASPTISVLPDSESGTAAIDVQAEGVTVSGLTVERIAPGERTTTGQHAQGIVVRRSNVTVEDNQVIGDLSNSSNDFELFDGIVVLDPSDGGTTENVDVVDNDVSGFDTGVVVTVFYGGTVSNVTLTDNGASDNRIGFVAKAHSGTVSDVGGSGNDFTGNANESIVLSPVSYQSYGKLGTVAASEVDFDGPVLVEDGDSIQTAVDVAAEGATVRVGPGTYEESVTIATPKVTLESTAGADGTEISADATEGVMIKASDVTVRGFTVTTNLDDTGTHGQYGIRLEPSSGVENIHIENNVIQDISDTYRPTGISLDMKTTSGNTAEDVTVRDNVVRNISSVESEYDVLAKGINANERFDNLIVENNTVQDIGDEHSAGANGIDLSPDGGVDPSVGPENFTITQNDIDGITVDDQSYDAAYLDANALYIHTYANFGAEHTVTQNSFEDGRVYRNTAGVTDPDTLNATENYWGASSGPGGQGPGYGSDVSQSVEFEPFYTDAALQTLSSSVGSGTVDQNGTATVDLTADPGGVEEVEVSLGSSDAANSVTAVESGGPTGGAAEPSADQAESVARYVDISADKEIEESVTITIAVERTALDVDDVERAVLLHFVDDGWVELETDATRTDDDRVRLEATATSLSPFAVAVAPADTGDDGDGGGGGGGGGGGAVLAGTDSVSETVRTGPIQEITAGFDRSTTGTVSVSAVEQLPAGAPTPPGTLIAAVDISPPTDVADRPGTVELAVSRSAVEDADAQPSDLQIVRFDEETGELDRLETDVASTTGQTIVLAADTPGFSVFGVVAVDQPAQQTPTPTATPTATATATETGTPMDTQTETPEETEPAPGTPTPTEGSGSGFGAVVAVIALLAAAGLVRRSRN